MAGFLHPTRHVAGPPDRMTRQRRLVVSAVALHPARMIEFAGLIRILPCPHPAISGLIGGMLVGRSGLKGDDMPGARMGQQDGRHATSRTGNGQKRSEVDDEGQSRGETRSGNSIEGRGSVEIYPQGFDAPPRAHTYTFMIDQVTLLRSSIETERQAAATAITQQPVRYCGHARMCVRARVCVRACVHAMVREATKNKSGRGQKAGRERIGRGYSKGRRKRGRERRGRKSAPPGGTLYVRQKKKIFSNQMKDVSCMRLWFRAKKTTSP